MSVFNPCQLLSLAQAAFLYSGFQAPFEELPPRELEAAYRFASPKWDARSVQHYINSIRADRLLVKHAHAQGYDARLNNTSDWDLSFNFNDARPETRLETKRMQDYGEACQVVIMKSFNETHACQKWRDFDVFIPWYVKDDIFIPFAAVSNRLWAYDAWETAWKPNNGAKRGRHLDLAKLNAPYNAGVILLQR